MRRSILALCAAALLGSATAADFIVGADVSTLAEVERHGGRFSDAEGRPGDALKILQQHGVGWVRLRLWHTPVNAQDVIEEGRVISRLGEPVGGGNNGLAVTLALARRAKALGLKLLLDMHYSDFWADPATQTKPAAWASLQGAELQRALHAYTAEVLRAFEAAKAGPDMLQIGNETNGGFVWPDGKTWQQTPDEKIGGDAGFVALLRQGIAAVRAHDARTGRRLPVVLHLADGGDNTLYRRVFDLFAREKLDFDIIGLSYYPYFHGPLAGLKANLADLSTRYQKPLLVVETAYAHTLANADATPNVLNAERVQAAGYPATVSGQAALLRDVIDAVAAAPEGRGLGVFYWEPAWIAVPGAGWRTGEGNGWDNQAMFDATGRALPSMKAFRGAGVPVSAPASVPTSVPTSAPASSSPR
ncbi:glycoside hydrolase family 53 protein [Aquabacterium sp.]|uniref:glycoside hydrolase family 53 protein n=1 Tax=Aquabacterium sp. TaxID=1872578 RepID=UPI002BA8C015|nr:glycosyl hydrolase 53 family protein [Aquabacterium sp.]HSW04389.1 glycosyl hydrolase 53 family protein [Aquabacterium sp.]